MNVNGITYLISVLTSSDDPEFIGLKVGQIAEALKQGVTFEPNKLDALVKAYEGRLHKTHPGWSAGKIRLTTLTNIVVYAIFADYGREAGETEQLDLSEYLDDTSKYGSAMKLLAEYIGIKGPALRKFLTEEQPIH